LRLCEKPQAVVLRSGDKLVEVDWLVACLEMFVIKVAVITSTDDFELIG
jgi:hypothetical protein